MSAVPDTIEKVFQNVKIKEAVEETSDCRRAAAEENRECEELDVSLLNGVDRQYHPAMCKFFQLFFDCYTVYDEILGIADKKIITPEDLKTFETYAQNAKEAQDIGRPLLESLKMQREDRGVDYLFFILEPILFQRRIYDRETGDCSSIAVFNYSSQIELHNYEVCNSRRRIERSISKIMACGEAKKYITRVNKLFGL
jgi:hypothetical protein